MGVLPIVQTIPSLQSSAPTSGYSSPGQRVFWSIEHLLLKYILSHPSHSLRSDNHFPFQGGDKDLSGCWPTDDALICADAALQLSVALLVYRAVRDVLSSLFLLLLAPLSWPSTFKPSWSYSVLPALSGSSLHFANPTLQRLLFDRSSGTLRTTVPQRTRFPQRFCLLLKLCCSVLPILWAIPPKDRQMSHSSLRIVEKLCLNCHQSCKN